MGIEHGGWIIVVEIIVVVVVAVVLTSFGFLSSSGTNCELIV